MARPVRAVAAVCALALCAASCVREDSPSGDSARRSASEAAAAAGAAAVNASSAPTLPTTVGALPAIDPAAYEDLLRQLRGTPAVVNIWASWCGPCREEAPALAAAARAHGRDVQFLGVDIQDARASARSFIAEFGWTYPSVYDATGAVRDALGIVGVPATVFYDRGGAIVDTRNGPIDAGELERTIDLLLA